MEISKKINLLNRFKEIIYAPITEQSIQTAETEGAKLIEEIIDSDILDQLFTLKNNNLSEFEYEIYQKLGNDIELKYKNMLLFSFLQWKNLNYDDDEFYKDITEAIK